MSPLSPSLPVPVSPVLPSLPEPVSPLPVLPSLPEPVSPGLLPSPSFDPLSPVLPSLPDPLSPESLPVLPWSPVSLSVWFPVLPSVFVESLIGKLSSFKLFGSFAVLHPDKVNVPVNNKAVANKSVFNFFICITSDIIR